jgi:hypothetical protein
MNDRNYVIIAASELNKVDFTQVMETSVDTLRYSLDGLYTFVKFEGETPSFFGLINDKSQQYSHTEILEILAGPEWTSTEMS